MKNTKKALASLAIAGMTLSMLPYNAFATGAVPTRISGTTAAQTAIAIADQTGWTGTAILASSASYGMVDALTAGPLASYLKAPILLTGPGNTLDSETKAELTKLAVKTVYVTSGTAVISQAVLNELTDMGITVVPLGGIDRAETSVNIAKKMAGVTKVAVANGLQDALSIAAVASAANEPILLTDKDAVPASVTEFLTANPGITASDVIGGTGIISDAVKANFPSATRHAGVTAYDTNSQVIQDFDSSLKYDNVYVANGITGIDALAGAPLAAQTKSTIVLTDGTVPSIAKIVSGKLAAGSVVTALGGTAVVPESVRVGVVTGIVTPPNGTLSVSSVSAVSANSFKVVFSQAPTDPSKVTFNVQRSSTPVTVSATWNTANTEATVMSTTNFPEGSYTVAVKNDTTDLGTSTLAVTSQKVAKIIISSDKLSVANITSGSTTTQTGYATYKVLDQYDNDITSSYLANSLVFQSGVGDVVAKDGILTLTPTEGMNLIQFATVVITSYDSTSGVSTSATLNTSTALGTLSDMTLAKLTNVDDKALTAGDTSSTWYIDYTATDISGNATTSFDLIKGGLILSDDNKLTTSSSYVSAQVVQDPTDSKKAAIEVKVTGDSVSMDIPVTITAMTYTGKSSALNLTLKKAAMVDSFTVMAPAYDIAVNETKEIPFVAYDQNGVQVTNFNDLDGNVTFSPSNVTLSQNVDGTAKLMVGPFTGTGPQIITAITPSGKLSSVTLNIQKAVKADSLALDSSVLVSAMQEGGSTQGLDFGYNYGGFSAKDQYGRKIDMQANDSLYEVLATTTGNVTATSLNTDKSDATDSTPAIAYGGSGIKITAGAAGTGTVTFKLIAKADQVAVIAGDNTKVIDTKSATFSIVANKDIKGYKLDTVTNPIYANTKTDADAVPTLRDAAYEANPYVYGTTASGSLVVPTGNLVIGAYVDNTTDFQIYGGPSSYDSVEVIANKLANNVTTATTNLTVTIKNAYDGAITSLTTPIKSQTTTPVASTIAASVASFETGVSINASGDVVTAPASMFVAGKSLARFTQDGTKKDRAPVYFYAVDSYGTKAMQLAQILKVGEKSTATDAEFNVDQYGLISGTEAVPGTYVTLSGVTTNGLVKTIKIVFTAGE